MPVYRNNEITPETCNTPMRTVNDELSKQRDTAEKANELAFDIEKYVCGYSDREPNNVKAAADSLASAIGENTDIIADVINSLVHILDSLGILKG